MREREGAGRAGVGASLDSVNPIQSNDGSLNALAASGNNAQASGSPTKSQSGQ